MIQQPKDNFFLILYIVTLPLSSHREPSPVAETHKYTLALAHGETVWTQNGVSVWFGKLVIKGKRRDSAIANILCEPLIERGAGRINLPQCDLHLNDPRCGTIVDRCNGPYAW